MEEVGSEGSSFGHCNEPSQRDKSLREVAFSFLFSFWQLLAKRSFWGLQSFCIALGDLVLFQRFALSAWALFQRNPPVGKSCKRSKTYKPFSASRLARPPLCPCLFFLDTVQESFCGFCLVKTDIKQLGLILCIASLPTLPLPGSALEQTGQED